MTNDNDTLKLRLTEQQRRELQRGGINDAEGLLFDLKTQAIDLIRPDDPRMVGTMWAE